MPKDRRMTLLSSNRDKASPYASISKHSNHGKSGNSLPAVTDETEWKEARCPICMEHPHNAVLLLCSSCTKGCRPYICNTSSRHSNCLDQFLNFSGVALSTEQRDFYHAETQSFWIGVVLTILRPTNYTEGRIPKVLCPFCRARIIGWVVVENVRSYMNSKVRNCSLESCDFSGNYIVLRKHARSEHPYVKPSYIDPERRADWAMLVYESRRETRDTLNLVESQFEYEEFSVSSFDSDDDSIAARMDDNSTDTSVASDFIFSLLYDIFGPNGSLTVARSPCKELVTSISQAYNGDRIPSSRRQNTTVPSSTGSERVRGRTDDRLSDRRSVGSGSENTVNERSGCRSLDRRSTGGSTSRFQSQASPRMARETGRRRDNGRSFDLRSNSQSEFASCSRVNTGNRRIGGRSTAERSVARRSSNQVARTTSHGRLRNPHHHH